MSQVNENNGTEYDDQNAFESFICGKLEERGIIVQPTGKKTIRNKCANLLGIDIIHDRMIDKRGGIYIETHTLEFAQNPIFITSTIFKNTGAWLYGIGDQNTFFIFAKRLLQKLVVALEIDFVGLDDSKPICTGSGKGLFMPFAQAADLAAKTIYFSHKSYQQQ